MKLAANYSAAITAALLPLVYWTTWRVLTGPFSAEVQSVVIGAITGTVLGSVCGFWLGSSASSQRKTELTGAGKADEAR
jgi:membrane protein YqaA with SNARE-associated domain